MDTVLPSDCLTYPTLPDLDCPYRELCEAVDELRDWAERQPAGSPRHALALQDLAMLEGELAVRRDMMRRAYIDI